MFYRLHCWWTSQVFYTHIVVTCVLGVPQLKGIMLDYMRQLMKAMPDKCKMQSYSYGSPGTNSLPCLSDHKFGVLTYRVHLYSLVKNLGVTLDSDVSMSQHITNMY